MAPLRQALRFLLRRPAFSLSVVVILTIGIGASTAVFTALDATVLQPLPLPDSARLVVVRELEESREQDSGMVSLQRFQRLATETTAFEGLAARSFHGLGFSLRTPDGTVSVPLSRATHEYFSVLGVEPLLGRNFTPEEDAANAATVALIPYEIWQTYFGGDPDVVGKTLAGTLESATIIGVLPPTFIWPIFAERVIWFNFGHYVRSQPPPGTYDRYLDLVGRLKPGSSASDARDQVAAIIQSDPEVAARPGKTRVEVLRLQEAYLGDNITRLWLLFWAVQLLLFMTVANTLIAFSLRLSERSSELALRRALGGGSRRLVQVVALEAGLLFAAGSVAGLILANLLIGQWPALMPFLAQITPVRLHAASLAYTAAVVVVAVILVSLTPLAVLRSRDLVPALKGVGPLFGRRSRGQQALVAGQIGLSALILVGAAMTLRSHLELTAVPIGFGYEGIVSRIVLMPGADFRGRPVDWIRDYKAIESEIRSLPFVSSAALGVHPLQPRFRRPVRAAGRSMMVEERQVGDHYFETLSIPLRAGREFSLQEGREAVAILSRATAKELFGEQHPIGRVVTLDPASEGQPVRQLTVVGVAEDVRYRGPREPADPVVYLPLLGFGRPYSWLFIRGAGLEHTPEINRAVWTVNPDLPSADLYRLADSTPLPFYRNLTISTLVLSFAAGAGILVLLVGTFGLVGYAASQQQRSVAVRYAVGARRGDIYSLLTRRFVALAAVSAVVGALLARGLSPLIEPWLFEVSASDWSYYVAAVGACIACVTASALLAARRAVSLSPSEVLRSE